MLAAGADIKEMNDMTFAEMNKVARKLQAGLGAIAAVTKPTVAAITGYALGGGCEVALGADRRIAGDNAKLGVPEILLGVIPGGGGSKEFALRLSDELKEGDIRINAGYFMVIWKRCLTNSMAKNFLITICWM